MFSSLTSLTVEIETRAARPRRISVLGATGSIGESTLDLIGRDPTSYRVVALTGGCNAARLAELAILHRAELAVIADRRGYAAFAPHSPAPISRSAPGRKRCSRPRPGLPIG